MSPAEHHLRPRSWMSTEDLPDNTTERHLQDLRDAADDRRATTDRTLTAHESPAAGPGLTASRPSPVPDAGSEPPMSSRKGG